MRAPDVLSAAPQAAARKQKGDAAAPDGTIAETAAVQERGVEELIAEHLMANLEIITEPELVGFWVEKHTDTLTWARSCGILIQGEGHRQVGNPMSQHTMAKMEIVTEHRTLLDGAVLAPYNHP